MDKVSAQTETWPTEAPVDQQEDAPRLATRVSRLFAAIFDVIFGFGVGCVFLAMSEFVSPEVGLVVGLLMALAMGVVQIAGLTTRGQTLGKQFMAIRVERTNGDAAGFLHAFFLRYSVPAMTAGAVASLLGAGADTVFWLVDALFIFGAAQRCVHDLIADTRVVDA